MNGTFLSKVSDFLRHNLILIPFVLAGIIAISALLLWLSHRAVERPVLCWFDAQGRRVEGDPLMHQKGDSPVFDCRVEIGTAKTLDR